MPAFNFLRVQLLRVIPTRRYTIMAVVDMIMVMEDTIPLESVAPAMYAKEA